MFEDKYVNRMIDSIEPLYTESDRYKQRAGMEAIAGLLRGSKHWYPSANNLLWSWFMERLPVIFTQIKPDTTGMWESFFDVSINLL